MGKGDQKSKRGKIHRGTFGKRRPKPKTHKPNVAGDGSSEGQAASAKTKEPKVIKKQPKE
jgi:30S ribosomal protein S31